MANRYTYQFNASFKPKMMQIEGFVSVGTGGLVNTSDVYPVTATGIAGGQTGVPRGLLPGNTVLGLPTGWVGGFSGCLGLIGAGVNGITRTATGLYTIQLEDDYVRLDSCQVTPVGTGLAATVQSHTVGLGNSTATKNQVVISFTSTETGQAVDVPISRGFYLDIRVRNSLSGPQ